MAPEAIDRVRRLEAVTGTLPQVAIHTDHQFHAGSYARTVFVPAGTLITGALIKIDTLLIVQGHASVYVGDGTLEVEGYTIIPASAGRKQAFVAHSDMVLTMIFATEATTIEQAESEFTDEPDLLMTRKPCPA